MAQYGIFDYKELIEYDAELLIFGKVDFKEDFGPWKRYDCCEQLRLDFASLEMSELTANGSVIRTVKMRLTPA